MEEGSSSPAETMHRAALLFNHRYQSRQASRKSGIFPAAGQNEAVFKDHTPTPEYRLWGDKVIIQPAN